MYTTYNPDLQPTFIGLTIFDDPWRDKSMVPLSRLRLRQLLTDQKGCMLCPTELNSMDQLRKQKTSAKQLWKVWDGDYPACKYVDIALTITEEDKGDDVPSIEAQPLKVEEVIMINQDQVTWRSGTQLQGGSHLNHHAPEPGWG